MRKQYTLKSIEPAVHGSAKIPIWRVAYDRGDGTVHLHIMPQDIFAIRAAEYDMDVDDVDALIDLVLYEPFIDSMEEDGTPILFGSGSLSEAREKYLSRINQAKEETITLDIAPTSEARTSKSTDLLDVLREGYRKAHPRREAIRAEVASARAQVQRAESSSK
ncbi:hypothetical protein ACPYPG_08195 [Streptomyces sp. FR-108]|uniref:hypothetical protein n=1 Tax=Streptomyces sp. FR-108 TaxID=3416665 RepID=UPI003CFB528A